ncbi:MAG: M24 family metallopeptidase [SAR202 cluster bacterium]|nr:M24 family metallopeptidase [SAR202 cluster bacterium]
MGKAAAINDQVLKEVLTKVEIGMTEIQIAGLAEAIARQMGADIASATVVMSGPNTNYPAWRPSNRKVEAGDFLMIDFNPAVNHYCNDGGITVLLPGGDPEQERALITGHEALKSIIPNIKPNISAKVIFDNLLNYLKPHGLEKNFTPYAKGLRGVGHGVGLDVVERPNLSSDSDFNIIPGMTLAIKLDLHGLIGGGYRIEIVVAVTDNGVTPLNKLILEESNDFTIIRE